MNNVTKCQRCNKNLIEEEFHSHVCTPNIICMKEIVIDYYYELEKDVLGDSIVIAKGLDGTLYKLRKCPHNPPHQPKGNTDNIPTRY